MVVQTMISSAALAAPIIIQGLCDAYIAPNYRVARPSVSFANRLRRAHPLFSDYRHDEDPIQSSDDEVPNDPSLRDLIMENPELLDKLLERDDINYEDDSNLWISSDIDQEFMDAIFARKWDKNLNRIGSKDWSAFSNLDTSSSNEAVNTTYASSEFMPNPEDDGEEAWLDTLASISAEEINFMSKEAERADQVRQMQELGFGAESISNTLGVATDDVLERDLDNKVFEAFKEETAKSGFGMYVKDEIDPETVESHTRVDWDDELDEPVRSQMVYVDEHTCVGCTNCAMIAQSTFFMEAEHGRARVFQQWGDDDETIQIAIETCPVDCIHYVPYEELKALEIQRRDQNINFKARLVNQGEYQASAGNTARYGGSKQFTDAQTISGNMGARCNNCPSRGCQNCPMYGVGNNPEFKKKEKQRKERLQKAAIKRRRESEEKRAEL